MTRSSDRRVRKLQNMQRTRSGACSVRIGELREALRTDSPSEVETVNRLKYPHADREADTGMYCNFQPLRHSSDP